MSKFNSTTKSRAITAIVTAYLFLTAMLAVMGWFGYFRIATGWEGALIGVVYTIFIGFLALIVVFIFVKVLEWIFKDDDF